MKKLMPALVMFCNAQKANAADFADLKDMEMFNGSSCFLTTKGFMRASTAYPEELSLTVPFHGEDLVLEVTADNRSRIQKKNFVSR